MLSPSPLNSLIPPQGDIEFTSGSDVSPDQVTKALCRRVITARGEVMEKRHTESEASYGRDVKS